MWEWARQRGILSSDAINPWFQPLGPQTRKASKPDRSLGPDEVTALLQAYRQRDRLGDIMRLALVTGCRSGELAGLPVQAVDEGATGFRIIDGKTANASRYVPLLEPAQVLIGQRLESLPARADRVFPEWPIRPRTGKCSALPQELELPEPAGIRMSL